VADWEQKAQRLLDRFNLLEHIEKVGRELSKGMSQKVSICCALLIDSDVILFDEPMIGLDPAAIRELKTVFAELKEENKTVLISTHIIDSVKELWDKAYIMHKGNVEKTLSSREVEADSLESIFFEVTGQTGEEA
jgi:ABC-type multidrug transport system ATPase subunit